MHDKEITWDALLVTSWIENNNKRTIWEKKQFTAPDAKDSAYATAIKIFESSNSDSRKVSVKNVIRIGTEI